MKILMHFHSINSMPFDVDSYFSWFITMIFCLITGSTYSVVNVSILSYFMVLANFFQARRKHFGYIFKSIDHIHGKRHSKSNIKIKKQFLEAIRMHIETKKYRIMSNTMVLDIFILFFFFWFSECLFLHHKF